MTELKLDFDTHRICTIDIGRKLRDLGLRVRWIRLEFSKSGNYHLVIAIRGQLEHFGIVAAQSILGSHPQREIYNFLRVSKLTRVPKFWRSRWNRLYDSQKF